LYKNKVKIRIAEKKPVLGCIVNGPYPALVEILGLVGFHFVFIDQEHSSLSLSQCEDLIRASELRDIVPIVRVPENNPKQILHFLDIGAMGLILPDIRSREEAEAVVQASKYAPMGNRGLATTRSADYGFGKPKPELFKQANDETLLIGIIESQEGVENASEIMGVKGIDGCFIGTSDLSMSMGHLGNVNHEEVKKATKKILDCAIEQGKFVGIVVRDGESPKTLFDMGFSMIFLNIHSLLKRASRKFIAEAIS
jgi:4-hydroxy-2-oxoheptanedioate aldolase